MQPSQKEEMHWLFFCFFAILKSALVVVFFESNPFPHFLIQMQPGVVWHRPCCNCSPGISTRPVMLIRISNTGQHEIWGIAVLSKIGCIFCRSPQNSHQGCCFVFHLRYGVFSNGLWTHASWFNISRFDGPGGSWLRGNSERHLLIGRRAKDHPNHAIIWS